MTLSIANSRMKDGKKVQKGLASVTYDPRISCRDQRKLLRTSIRIASLLANNRQNFSNENLTATFGSRYSLTKSYYSENTRKNMYSKYKYQIFSAYCLCVQCRTHTQHDTEYKVWGFILFEIFFKK
jgi:hypothetical protein